MNGRGPRAAKGKQEMLLQLLGWIWPSAKEEVFHLRERLRYGRQFGNLQDRFWRDHFAPHPPRVLSGPFQGMKYLRGTVMGPPLPRWLGTYETELHELIRSTLLTKAYELILVVGSAEGYYASGLSRLFPRTRILSFEGTAFSRWQQKRLLAMNRVTNVEVRGRLEIPEFRRLVNNKKSFCLLDVEGAEADFCGKDSWPWLTQTDLLVEIHAAGSQSPEEVLQMLRTGLDATHRTVVLEHAQRDLAQIKKSAGLKWSLEELRDAAEEHRGFDQKWLWAEAKAS